MRRSDKSMLLDRLVREHLPDALRFAIRLTGSPDAAEEIIQESLLRVARGIDSFRAEATFKTWFYQIIVNVFRDDLRRRRPQSPLAEEPVDSAGNNPASRAETNEMGRIVAQHVSALPPRQREVLTLIAFEKMEAADVARVLNITPANVHSTLHIARERLKLELATWLVEK